ncbi:MAG: hypothetical protein IPQ07_40100 [Myxococcales bacterium]|nr:hypothetical protein [Myxococcales bacterium]
MSDGGEAVEVSTRDVAVAAVAEEVSRYILARAAAWLDGSRQWVEWMALDVLLPTCPAIAARAGERAVAEVVEACCSALRMASEEQRTLGEDLDSALVQYGGRSADSRRRIAFELVDEVRKLAALYGTPAQVEALAEAWRAF